MPSVSLRRNGKVASVMEEMIFTCVDGVTGKRLYWRGQKGSTWVTFPWKNSEGHRYSMKGHAALGLKRIQ
jgi:hypothetical protein